MTEVAVYLVPTTFGFGPAALATAVGRQIRARHPDIPVVGVADGIALEFLRGSEVFGDAIEESSPGAMPDHAGRDGPAVAVFFGDFDRLRAASGRDIRTVVVDALYWMWDHDPADPAAVDLYLALAFPGLAERIRQRGARASGIRVVPQIVDSVPPSPDGKRSRTMLNLGGAIAPMGSNHAYLRTLIEIVADAVRGAVDLQVTCSSAAAEVLSQDGPISGAAITPLTSGQMMTALGQCARLLTLPGQSIMWEALQMQAPTVVLPGANYSQHQQLRAYQQFFSGIPFIAWDDIDGYATLPAGLPEPQGVALAADLGNRLASDNGAQAQLAALIGAALTGEAARSPQLQPGHPWSDFSGAAQVANDVAALARHAR